MKSQACLAATPPVCESHVFDGVDKQECTLYVPGEGIEAYANADQWRDFTNIKEYIAGDANDDGMVPVSDIVTDVPDHPWQIKTENSDFSASILDGCPM